MKRTEWYPNSVDPMREGEYEWRCDEATAGETERAEWLFGRWWTVEDSLGRSMLLCNLCQWRGLTKPAERAA